MTQKKKDPDKKLIDEALELESHGWEPVTPPDVVTSVRAQFRMPEETILVVPPAPAVVEAVGQIRINGAHKPHGDVTRSLADSARLRRRHG